MAKPVFSYFLFLRPAVQIAAHDAPESDAFLAEAPADGVHRILKPCLTLLTSSLSLFLNGHLFSVFFVTLNIFKTPNGYLILPVLAVLSQLLMTKFSGMNQQPAAQPANSQQNPQQQQSETMNKFMKYFFPIFTGWICLTSNASFALYWVTSNIVAGISNYAITKYYQNPAKDVKEVIK